MKLPVALALTFAALAAIPSSTVSAAPPPRPRLTWLGHAGFELISPAGTRIWIDPWLLDNPAAPADYKDLAKLASHKPDAILVTHPHGDHAGDVALLASLTGAKVIAPAEHLRAMVIPEAQQLSINVGGSFTLGDLTISAVPAMHSSQHGGRPLGFVIRLPSGRSIYHTGDTGLFGDMALIEELHHPSVLLIASGGGRWGIDPRQAALAVRKFFRPTLIIPMHFGTLPELAKEPEVRAAFSGDKRLVVLVPGVPRELD